MKFGKGCNILIIVATSMTLKVARHCCWGLFLTQLVANGIVCVTLWAFDLVFEMFFWHVVFARYRVAEAAMSATHTSNEGEKTDRGNSRAGRSMNRRIICNSS